MSSTSGSDGSYTLTITFDVGTDLNTSLALVQNLVNSALAQLPGGAQRAGGHGPEGLPQHPAGGQPLFRGRSLRRDLPLQLRASSTCRTPWPGSRASARSGSSAPAPTACGSGWTRSTLQTFGLTTTDVLAAIQGQNVQVVAGQLGGPPVPGEPALPVHDQRPRPALRCEPVREHHRSRSASGTAPQIVRLRDVARVELSQQNFSNFSRFTGHKSAQIVMFALPGANAIAVADSVYKAMAEMSKQFPEGLKYAIRYDTTTFVREAISAVYNTLFIAGVLVLIVILLFLQNFRAHAGSRPPPCRSPSSAPSSPWPALGFTVNLMTLFALILAIGIVVDDAIVIVENSSYYIEQGLPPKDATIKAMEELTGPVMGITLALVAVFLPAAFLPGITGQIFRQFALVIAATAVISAHQRADLEAGPVRALAEAPRGQAAQLVLPRIQPGLRGRDQRLHGHRHPDGEAAGAHDRASSPSSSG